jgi:hypothetical protein
MKWKMNLRHKVGGLLLIIGYLGVLVQDGARTLTD